MNVVSVKVLFIEVFMLYFFRSKPEHSMITSSVLGPLLSGSWSQPQFITNGFCYCLLHWINFILLHNTIEHFVSFHNINPELVIMMMFNVVHKFISL